MTHTHPDKLREFSIHDFASSDIAENLTFTNMTTLEITSLPKKKQDDIIHELNLFFPKIFKKKDDWEYMIRHFFYKPLDNTIRQTVFVRNKKRNLIALYAFDNGIFQIRNKETHLAYIHIRAIVPEYQKYGIGRIFSEKILTDLKPDMLLTTCVQLASLYSWIKIKNPDIRKHYQFFPRIKTEENIKKTVCLPLNELDFTIQCFKKIYKSHVKEDQKKLDYVVNNITIHMIRKGVGTHFDYLKWHENNKISQIAKDLGITEKDAILLVIKKINS